MNVLIVLLFIIPGYIVEFAREYIFGSNCCDCKKRKESIYYQMLRGLYYNVPLVIFVWIITWIWKVVLGNDPAFISSLADFWNRAINQVFLLKYCIVYLFVITLYVIGFYLYKRCKCKPPCHHPCRPKPCRPPCRPDPCRPPCRPDPCKPPCKPDPCKPPWPPRPPRPPFDPDDCSICDDDEE